MNKKITVIGLIILILGTTGIVLGNMDVLSLKERGQEVSRTYTGNNSIPTDVISRLDDIGPFYSAVRVFFVISTNDADTTFTVKLGLNFPNEDYLGCPASSTTPCEIPGAEVTIINPTPENTYVLTSAESPIISIPILMSGLELDSSIQHDYWLMVETDSSQSYTLTYLVDISWRITVPIGLIFGIIGSIVLILGMRKSPSSKYRPLPTRPAFEPTIGGGTSTKNSKSSKKSKKSKKIKPTASKRASKNTCVKCNGVMPKNAQYCPHCYTRQ